MHDAPQYTFSSYSMHACASFHTILAGTVTCHVKPASMPLLQSGKPVSCAHVLVQHCTKVTYTVTLLNLTCVLNRCMHTAFCAYNNSPQMSKTG